MLKPQVSLIDPDFLLDMAKVLEYGDEKYGVRDWAKTEDYSRVSCLDALFRHILAYSMGEINDRESGESHLIHAAARCMMLYYFQKTGRGKKDLHYFKEIDDFPF